MTFTVTYPLFLIVTPDQDDAALIDLKNDDGAATAKGIAVFTDKDGAEEFRDEYHPSCVVAPLCEEQALAKVLTLFKNRVTEVIFDPYRIGKRCQSITVSEMLEQLPPVDF